MTPFKQRLRDALKNLELRAKGHDKYGNNGYVVLSGKKYSVGCIFYNEYYIEPYRRNRSERDSFHEDTLWECSNVGEIVELLENNGIII